jgi:hypothetical protein
METTQAPGEAEKWTTHWGEPEVTFGVASGGINNMPNITAALSASWDEMLKKYLEEKRRNAWWSSFPFPIQTREGNR